MNLIWVRTPVSLIGKLSCNSLVLLSLLLNSDYGSHAVSVTRGQIAKQMNCSVRTVDAMLAELLREGLITGKEITRDGLMLRLKPDILPPRKNMPYPKSDAPKPENLPQTPTDYGIHNDVLNSLDHSQSSLDMGLIEQMMKPY